jgi:hypothetical protein
LLAGTIVVELQPVAVRGLKVYSLACRGVLAPGEGVVAVVEHALECHGQLPPIGVEDDYMQQASVALRRRRRRPAGTVPGVKPDVVVAPAGRKAASTTHRSA